MGDVVIIPTDGSKHAENAADVGFDLAAKTGATVHALSVGDTSLTHRSSIGAGPGKTSEEVTEIAAGWAKELAEAARSAGLDAEAVVRTGIPAEEIAEYAAETDASMVVIGTAGRSGFERRLVGSTTDKVVGTAPVPVVTVRPDGAVDAA